MEMSNRGNIVKLLSESGSWYSDTMYPKKYKVCIIIVISVFCLLATTFGLAAGPSSIKLVL
jgi:hypothetical protein